MENEIALREINKKKEEKLMNRQEREKKKLEECRIRIEIVIEI